MNQDKLTVKMLGELQLSWNGNILCEEDSRSRKTWLLLAYLIYCRHRHIPQSEIIDFLWKGGSNQANPQGTLKTTMHRLRNMLNQLAPEAGHTLILRQENGYRWNPEIELDFDVEKFNQISYNITDAADAEAKLALCLQGYELYQGDFLEKFSSETWVSSNAVIHHTLYVQMVCEGLEILEGQNRTEEIIAICQKALSIEPFSEQLCCTYLRALISRGQTDAAVEFYEDICRRLMNQFRSMPWESLRKLYRQAVQIDNGNLVPIDDILAQLREENYSIGALFCEYDFFRTLYQAHARSIVRTGEEIHIGILTVKDSADKSMSQKSHDLVMKNLKEQICTSIRRGDIATRCSASQFIVMLPRANYDSSCMVCERIIRAFFRHYPHSPAEITYVVYPVEPEK